MRERARVQEGGWIESQYKCSVVLLGENVHLYDEGKGAGSSVVMETKSFDIFFESKGTFSAIKWYSTQPSAHTSER